jgi:PBP1b-binding outer membrane lipoprotein LpoB
MNRALLVIIVPTLGLAACNPAHRISTGGPESITTTSQIDVQDVQAASAGMIEGLLRSGIFQSFAKENGRKPILLFRDNAIINDSTSRLPMQMLTGDIKAELQQTLTVDIASTYRGKAGSAQDREAGANQRLRAFRGGDAAVPTPDFSLIGSITEMRSRAGSTHQLDLQFQLELTAWATGLSSWSETVKVSKQGDKPAVGL